MENEIKVEDDRWDLHIAFIQWQQSEAEGLMSASSGKREKINLLYLVLECDVASEKTDEPAILTTAFIGD